MSAEAPQVLRWQGDPLGLGLRLTGLMGSACWCTALPALSLLAQMVSEHEMIAPELQERVRNAGRLAAYETFVMFLNPKFRGDAFSWEKLPEM